jgi:dihydrofolate reductase
MITAIVAASNNWVIGRNNELCWYLPDDFKRFKQVTSNNFILMGRKTFETFPRPLPNRTHLIITNQENYQVPENCLTFKTIQDAIDYTNGQDIFIIGGGQIYKQCLSLIDRIDITKVNCNVEDGDTFFPEIGPEWQLKSDEFHDKDERHQFDFRFQIYERLP